MSNLPDLVGTDTAPVVHFLTTTTLLTSTSSFGVGRTFSYGDELRVTDEIREANKNRHGQSPMWDWLDGDEDIFSVGSRDVIGRGPWPKGKCRLLPGSYAWEDARQRDIEATWSEPDLKARAVRRREIDAYYGRPEATSRTLQTVTAEGGR